MGRKAFHEVFTSVLLGDHRFPLLEISFFIYILGSFVFFNSTAIQNLAIGSEGAVYRLIQALTGTTFYILMILMLKGIAYGLGNDLEKGVIQTLLTYPLKRRSILTARLVSSIGLSILSFLGAQIFALLVLIPDMVWTQIGTFLLCYIAILGYPLLLISIVLLLTLRLKKGGVAFAVGILLYFASTLVYSLLPYANSRLFLDVLTLFVPQLALMRYYLEPYMMMIPEEIWRLGCFEAFSWIGASYTLIILVFATAYLYFETRLEI